MKLIKIKKEYSKKDGSKGIHTSFYLVCENEQRVEICPSVRTYGEKTISNYNILDFLAIEVKE